MPSYFKEQLSNPLFVNGKQLPWTSLAGNNGYLATEAGSDLDIALSKTIGKMGVTRISDEELAQKKISEKLVAPALNRFGKRFLSVAGKKPAPASTPKVEPLFPPSEKAVPAEAAVPSAPAAPKLGKLKPVEATT